jgi:tRNA 5-methylaminomethyl-2-thiouridine biosynthesis bifunctional protein
MGGPFRLQAAMNGSLDPPARGFTPVAWGEDGAPRSARFDDVYYSTADGLAETRAVFLEGCGLPAAWAGRSAFSVGELGFGSGLNVVALLDLWRRTREPDARLNIFSIEAFPISADDARRALSAWPEPGEIAGLLTDRWPRAAAGFHRIDLPECAATLDLAIMDASEALAQWRGHADAWFLDGFAPSRNPDMWREAVLAEVARRSAPGARLATFTVAGAVRRGLAAQGFTVEKRPGFGRKSERLEARHPRPPPAAPPAPRPSRSLAAESPAPAWPGPSGPWASPPPSLTHRTWRRAPPAIPRPWSPRAWTPAGARSPPSSPRPWPGPAT